MKFRDNSKVSIMWKGNVTIQTEGNSFRSIANELFVPDLKTKLLSTGQLQEKVYEVSIKGGVCRTFDEKLGLIAQVSMTANRMFPLHLNNTSHTCFSTRLEKESWMWRYQYGHLNFGGLKMLQQKNMVEGLPKIVIPTQVYEECIVSKQPRNQFQKEKSKKAKKVLELVHSDLCRTITPMSNEGKWYFISFIDELSQKNLDLFFA